MTNKEIIDGLKMTMELITFDPSTGETIDPDNLNDLNRTTYDACNGAIEALEGKDANVTSNGTISRTDAIDAVAYAEDGKDAQRILEGLVSTIPEQSAQIQDILQFLDERLHPIISPAHWNVYSELHDMISMLPSAQPDVPDTNVGDTISRQAAIDTIKALWNDAPSAQHVSAMFDCEDAIRVLPSAQPGIIHCKDCIWHNKDINQCDRQVCAVMYADDFCSYGERRGEQE